MKNLKIFKIGLFVLLILAIAVLGSRFYLGRTIDVENFMKDLRDKIVKEDWLKIKDYNKVTLAQIKYSQSPLEEIEKGDYSGFDWLNEKNEVELIKGYEVEYDRLDSLSADIPSGENIAYTLKQIKSYLLEKGFVINKRNSYFCHKEEDFWAPEEGAVGGSGVGEIGFEKGNIKCLLSRPRLCVVDESQAGACFFTDKDAFELSCGDISRSQTPPLYKEFYNHINPAKDPMTGGSVERAVENSAIGTSNAKLCTAGGGWSLWKVENRKWELLQSTQMAWSCSILLENKVPPTLVDTCIFYECWECKGNECRKYEKECVKPGEPREFIYQELYEEKFGKEK